MGGRREREEKEGAITSTRARAKTRDDVIREKKKGEKKEREIGIYFVIYLCHDPDDDWQPET